MLEINDISFSLGSKPILNNLSFQLAQGEIVTLIGASGSGKTTLFKLLTGIYFPSHGSLFIGNQQPPKAYHQATYMTQDDLLLPWRTVLNNLLLIGELGKKPLMSKAFRDQALFYLKEVGLEKWQNAYPHQLSGGMRQRVSLARALMQKRPILLLDEPFAALDVGLREHMYALLQDVRRRYNTTILMVTHDFRDALSLSDRIFVLSNGQITKEWTIKPEIHQDPHQFQKLYEEMRGAIKSGC